MGIQDEDLVTKNRHGEKESGTHTDTQSKGTQPRPVREGRGGGEEGYGGRKEIEREAMAERNLASRKSLNF